MKSSVTKWNLLTTRTSLWCKYCNTSMFSESRSQQSTDVKVAYIRRQVHHLCLLQEWSDSVNWEDFFWNVLSRILHPAVSYLPVPLPLTESGILTGRYIMISPTHHYFAWHPESLYGICRNQLPSTVNGENPGSRPRWSMHTSWTTPQSDNRALLSLDNSGLSWTVCAPDKVTAVPVRRNGNFQTPISVPAARPKRCHTLSWSFCKTCIAMKFVDDDDDDDDCRILPTDKTTRWLV